MFVMTAAGRAPLTTNPEGRFHADGLATGDAAVVARGDPALYVPDRFTIVLQDGDNDVTLRVVEREALAEGNASPLIAVHEMQGHFSVSVVDPEPVAELTTGDELVAIDGVPLEGLGIRGVNALLRGPPASTVELELISVANETPYSVSLTRIGMAP